MRAGSNVKSVYDVGMSKRAAAYMRISEDRAKESFGVGTQRKRITALIEAKGWELVREFTDNSVSASKARGVGTAWADMLKAAKRAEFDVIVAVDLDRLLRQTADLVTLIDTGAKVVTVDGEIDLSTADGEFRATMLTGIARFEVRRKAERTKRANQQRREQGVPVVSNKILGYTEDGLELIENEAVAVRKAFDDFLTGVTLRQIGDDLTDAGFRTSKGKRFFMRNARYMLENARYAGLIRHHATGNLYPGNFPAIVSEDTWKAAVEKIKDPTRRVSPGNKHRWLLSGIAHCGRCGGQNMRVGKTTTGEPAYRCNDKAHLSRKAEPIDEYVNAVIVARLSMSDTASLFASPEPGVDVDQLRRDRNVLQSRLDGLASLLADGTLSKDSVKAASADLRKQVNDIDTALDVTKDSLVAEVADADDVESAWSGLDIERQRLIMDALMTVTILPVGRGGARAGFKTESIQIDPK